MIRLRTSTLEQFRRVVETSFEPEQSLIDRIVRGQWTDDPDVPWYMHAGTAWHRALADDKADDVIIASDVDECRVKYGDYLFHPDDISEGIAHFGPGLREITGRRSWDIGQHRVQLEGTADHLLGRVIQDAKTKFSDADPSDYEQSLQWRSYLLIHDCDVFRYNLFHFRDPDDAGFLKLKDVYYFNMWRYPEMESDLLGWLERFVGWARARGLTRYLENDKRRSA